MMMHLLKKLLFSRCKQKTDHPKPIIQHNGFCPTCDAQVTFTAWDSWLRDHLLCSGCGSIPRERALMHVIESYYPNFRELKIHESSPGERGASEKLAAQCSDYIGTHYDNSVPHGTVGAAGYQSEDLQDLTFADESFDLVITQDVLEHLFDPEKAFAEIARTLKPGGAHIFTVPLVNKLGKSIPCALLDAKGQVQHLMEPDYHGNPIDSKGSLVTMHWGYDICDFIFRSSGLFTTIVQIDNLDLGIRAELVEVLVSFKSK